MMRLVGVVERRQPLPPGRYWITVTNSDNAPDRVAHFFAWTTSNAQTVIVDKQEPLKGGTTTDRPNGSRWVKPVDGVFVIFTVLLKTTWDARQFGFPNVAGEEIQHASDTVQRPPEQTVEQYWGDFFNDFLASPIGRFALIGLLVSALTRSRND